MTPVKNMHITGVGGTDTINGKIVAIKELGWSQIEMHGVEAPGFPKANFHDIAVEERSFAR